MKKGFTLIELLGVIILLAVIALISTPLVLDVVDDARSGARKNSVFGYAEAVYHEPCDASARLYRGRLQSGGEGNGRKGSQGCEVRERGQG